MAKQGLDTSIVGAAINVEQLLGKQVRVMDRAFPRYPFGTEREDQKPELIENYTVELGSKELYGTFQVLLPKTFDPQSVRKGEIVELVAPQVVLSPKATLGKDSKTGGPKAYAHLEIIVEAQGLKPVAKV